MGNRMDILSKGKSMLIVAAIFAAAAAHASLADATILIDRAANSKTLTVRYDGASAVLVELRINGKSVASRVVNGETTVGETNFTIDIANLDAGDNKVEIRLYDKSDKVVGTQISTISVDRSGVGPVYITAPKTNATVQGYAEINVGFKTELKNVYVSFFVNDEFKILKNFPPYTYMWDTTNVPNGWHEVQAWVVDESNATFKTEKMRLFVNNPGGRTKREQMDQAIPNATAPKDPVKAPTTDVKAPNNAKTTGMVEARPTNSGGNLGTGPRMMNTQPVNNTGKQNDVKPVLPGKVIEITNVPTTNNVNPNDIVAVKLVAPKLKPINLNFGTKVDYSGNYNIYLDGKAIDFDVAPTVIEGVPVSPFRHLFEGYGGKVKWDNNSKTVEGESDDLNIWFKIGDPSARVGGNTIFMEMAPFIKAGRSIVPLSFMSEALKVNVQFDASTGHVLILSNRSK